MERMSELLHSRVRDLQNRINTVNHLVAGDKMELMSDQAYRRLKEAVLHNEIDTIKHLVADGANVNYAPRNCRLVFNLAVESTGSLECIQLLADLGARIDLRNDTGATALHVACMNGDEPKVKLLLDLGCNPAIQDRNQRCAVWIAVDYGIDEKHTQVLKLLVQQSANLDLQDPQGRTPLLRVINTSARWTNILLEGGANPNVHMISSGATPLHLSTHSKSFLTQLLVDHRADLSATDTRNQTALHWAAGIENLESIKILLEAGSNIHAKDKHERTPIEEAVHQGKMKSVELFVAYRAYAYAALMCEWPRHEPLSLKPFRRACQTLFRNNI